MQHSTTTVFPDLLFEIACNSQNTCWPQNNCCSSALNFLEAQGSIQTCRQIRCWFHWWDFHPLPLLEPEILQNGEGAQNGSDRGDTGAVRTSTPLGSSFCNQKVSPIKLTRLTSDPLENFSFCNTQQSRWMFQCFKMNVNIDVSLASTPRESSARVQGPSHCTATLPVLDELRMNCADSCGYQSAAAKRLMLIWDTLGKVQWHLMAKLLSLLNKTWKSN